MNNKILTSYIAAWAWHIIAIMFFLNAITFMLDNKGIPWILAYFFMIAICEFMAWKRQGELRKEEMINEQ